jgi:hypothetical protein
LPAWGRRRASGLARRFHQAHSAETEMWAKVVTFSGGKRRLRSPDRYRKLPRVTWWKIASANIAKTRKRVLSYAAPFELTQRFLREHIPQIAYNRSKVTMLGSVPVQRGTYQSAVPVPFRIEGELDRRAIRARPHKLQPDDGRWKKLPDTATGHLPAVAKEVALSSY